MSSLTIIEDICKGSKKDRQETIEAYEAAFKLLPQVDIPVTHYIHGGIYAREVTLPPGIVVIGQLYRFDHIEVMIKGSVTVSMETGDSRRLEGYNCFKAHSGKRRVVYVHTETTWVTFHSTPPKHEGEEIQKFLTAPNYEQFLSLQITASQLDYDRVAGKDKEWLKQVSECTEDCIEMPLGFDHIYIAKSKLQGQGVYSTLPLAKGSFICPARVQDMRTPAGRYANHSVCAVAEMVKTEEGFELIALKDIDAGEEITVNYRQVFRAQGVLCQG